MAQRTKLLSAPHGECSSRHSESWHCTHARLLQTLSPWLLDPPLPTFPCDSACSILRKLSRVHNFLVPSSPPSCHLPGLCPVHWKTHKILLHTPCREGPCSFRSLSWHPRWKSKSGLFNSCCNLHLSGAGCDFSQDHYSFPFCLQSALLTEELGTLIKTPVLMLTTGPRAFVPAVFFAWNTCPPLHLRTSVYTFNFSFQTTSFKARQDVHFCPTTHSITIILCFQGLFHTTHLFHSLAPPHQETS